MGILKGLLNWIVRWQGPTIQESGPKIVAIKFRVKNGDSHYTNGYGKKLLL